MSAETIGEVTCETCGWEHAKVKTTKKGMAMIYCDSCGGQNFARTEKGDKAIRAKMRALKPAAAPGAAPAAKKKSGLLIDE
jgi:hypothetical protein